MHIRKHRHTYAHLRTHRTKRHTRTQRTHDTHTGTYGHILTRVQSTRTKVSGEYLQETYRIESSCTTNVTNNNPEVTEIDLVMISFLPVERVTHVFDQLILIIEYNLMGDFSNKEIDRVFIALVW